MSLPFHFLLKPPIGPSQKVLHHHSFVHWINVFLVPTMCQALCWSPGIQCWIRPSSSLHPHIQSVTKLHSIPYISLKYLSPPCFQSLGDCPHFSYLGICFCLLTGLVPSRIPLKSSPLLSESFQKFRPSWYCSCSEEKMTLIFSKADLSAVSPMPSHFSWDLVLSSSIVQLVRAWAVEPQRLGLNLGAVTYWLWQWLSFLAINLSVIQFPHPSCGFLTT